MAGWYFFSFSFRRRRREKSEKQKQVSSSYFHLSLKNQPPGIYASLSSALRPASGGLMNPALSLAAVLGGRLAAASFLAYAAAQLGGGVVGAMISSLTVPGARLFRKAGAVGCLAQPVSAAAAKMGKWGGANWWRLLAWESVSAAVSSLALLSHSSPAFVALAFASVGAAAAAVAPSLGVR
jgi:glycerol uptake facilitator-like aquaporin